MDINHLIQIYKEENNGYVQGRRVNKVIEVGRMPFKYAKWLCT